MQACLRLLVALPAVVISPAMAGDDGAQPLRAAIPTAAAGINWVLRIPKEEKIAFRGVVVGEGSSALGAPALYPAPNVAGFLAGVLTHAFIISSVRDDQRSRQQEAADRILEPHKPVLDAYQHSDLMRRALAKTRIGGNKRLVGAAESAESDWLVESVPVFSMTQDQSAFVLDNAVAVYAPGGAASPKLQNFVRVVSRRQEADHLPAYWNANGGEPLREESARLLAESLDIALGVALAQSSGESGSHRTVRYYEGNAERMERGEVLGGQCDRLVIRNLRGWLMSVPVARGATATESGSCGEPPSVQKK